ncbi:MAG TPA: hypothetical protein VEJ43_05180 [Pseudolabrys sp.]|nr:hypothetical protein [Pseudolabrys sp.]
MRVALHMSALGGKADIADGSYELFRPEKFISAVSEIFMVTLWSPASLLKSQASEKGLPLKGLNGGAEGI